MFTVLFPSPALTMTTKYVYVACVPIKKTSEEILCGPNEHLHIQTPSYTNTDMQWAVLRAGDMLQHIFYSLEGEQEPRQPQTASLARLSVPSEIQLYASLYFCLYQDTTFSEQGRSEQVSTAPNSFQTRTSRNSDMLMSNETIFIGQTRIKTMFN